MIEVVHEHGWAVIRLAGVIDMVTVLPLRRCVQQLLAGGQAKIRFDVAGVEYLDGQGLNLVAGAHKRAQELEGRVEVVGASRQLARVFETSHLGSLMARRRDTGTGA